MTIVKIDVHVTGMACCVSQPIEIREACPEKACKVKKLGLLLPNARQSELNILTALESGRYNSICILCDIYKCYLS